jgi:hypothetical protein
MTKARTIADLGTGFVNISDTGTEGTKVASGTTAQRGSTAGQLRFNSQTGLAEYYTGTEFKVIDSPPTVTAVSPLEVDSQAGGDITFTITGSNFQSGAVVKFIGNDATEITASTTTINSGSSISAIIAKSSFVGAKEPYDVRVINTSGLSGTLDDQINVDTSPSWNTASGNIGSVEESASANFTVSATDPDGDTVVYSETTSVLSGTGLSLNSSTGAITGTASAVSGDTTDTFTLRATANSKTADRQFNIIRTEFLLDGSTQARANTSASVIKTLTSTTTDGLYWIKPSGYGGSAFQIYCRMSNIGTETGGYMLLGSFIGSVASNTPVGGYSQYDHTRDNSLNRTQGDTPQPSATVSPSRTSTTHRYLNSTYIDAIRNGGSNTKLLGIDRYKNVAVTSTDSEAINFYLNNQAWNVLNRDDDRNTVVVYDPSNNTSFIQNNNARWHFTDNGMAVREIWENSGNNDWILGHRGDIWTADVSSALHNEYYIK